MVTSVESKWKSGDFCRIPQNKTSMNKQEHYFRSMNLSDDEKVNLVDRWILACLIKGLQGKGHISKISLDKIAEYCKYTNEQGKEARFGIKTIQASIERLADAKMIRIIKPERRGQCTKYEIKDIKSYEKINDSFFTLDLSPTVKGYILCMLQHNLNKDLETHQPNDVYTKTTYNVIDLSNKFNTPISTIYKTEKTLKDLGILTVEENESKQRNQETGLILQNRKLDLQKLGLDTFVKVIVNHEQRLQNIELNTVTKEELYDAIAKLENKVQLLINAKEATYVEV